MSEAWQVSSDVVWQEGQAVVAEVQLDQIWEMKNRFWKSFEEVVAQNEFPYSGLSAKQVEILNLNNFLLLI